MSCEPNSNLCKLVEFKQNLEHYAYASSILKYLLSWLVKEVIGSIDEYIDRIDAW